MSLHALLSNSTPEVGVWRVRYRGHYADLCARLGQELFQDVDKVARAKDNIQQMLKEMVTQEGCNTMEQVIGLLSHFESRPTNTQKALRKVYEKMNFKGSTCRPSWAKGAHLVVNADVASEIEDMFEPGDLGKGDVVVSREYCQLLDQAISDSSIQCAQSTRLNPNSLVQVPLPVFSKVEASLQWLDLSDKLVEPHIQDLQDSFWKDLSFIPVSETASARMTHTTGSLPRDPCDASKSWGSAAYKRFTLKEVSRNTGESLNKERPAAGDGCCNGKEIDTDEPEKDSQTRSSMEDANDVDELEEEQYWVSFSKVLKLRFGWDVDGDELRAIAQTCHAPEAHSEPALTVFTIDEDEEEFAASAFYHSATFVDFAAQELQHFVAPPIKSPEAFGSYIEGRVKEMIPIIGAFIHSASPESVVTKLIGADKKIILGHMEHLKVAGQQCFEQDALRKVFRPASQKRDANSGLQKAFEESLSVVVKEVSVLSQKHFDKEYREQRRKLKKQLTAKFPDEVSAVVVQMQNAVVCAICSALSITDAPSAARKAWAESKDAHRRQVKKSQPKNTGVKFSSIPYNKGYAEAFSKNDRFEVSAED